MAGRKKVVLRRIADENKRKASLKKRKEGLLKKAGELSILCDVKCVVVIYSPGEDDPTIWSSVENARDIVETFTEITNDGNSSQAYTHERYITDKLNKLNEKLNQEKKKNDVKEKRDILISVTHNEKKYEDLNFREANILISFAGEMMAKIDKKMQQKIELHQ